MRRPTRRDLVTLSLGVLLGVTGCCSKELLRRSVELEGFGVKVKYTAEPVENQLLVLCSEQPDHDLCTAPQSKGEP